MPPADPANPPGSPHTDLSQRLAKAEWRARIGAGRRVPENAAAGLARTERALQACAGHTTIAVYASAGGEPDTWALIEALYADRRTLLLPLLGRRPDGSVRREPDWALYTGPEQVRPGFAGILEPVGPALGPTGLARASLIWCAGLAATPGGDRLGTGGGWYDRALGFAHADAVVGVLLRDAEVLPQLPVESFDRRVDLIVTESRILRAGRNSPAGRDRC
ncbi:MAG: 5-formyltetrahydrofolate cyclo-ligase [Micropruina sp.]|uniref:5-formyltetrahydrofolate cyclo-ligase n=1 Tax=Micropruina sp. TaxID=2737536 RepID=UPI0039E53652